MKSHPFFILWIFYFSFDLLLGEAVMILYIYSKQMHTFIIDEYGVFRSRKQPKHILEDLCMLYGSTMEGRK